MQRTALIIQARTGSRRLPRKVLRPILGRPLLLHLIERVRDASTIDNVIVATTVLSDDDSVERLAHEAGVQCFRGSETDVLDRYYRAARDVDAGTVVRITGDCPLHHKDVIDATVRHYRISADFIDYTTSPKNYPEGFDTEVFSFEALTQAALRATLPSEREHVTPYIKNHPELFIPDHWMDSDVDESDVRLSVDTYADFVFVTKIFEALYPANPLFTKEDIVAFVRAHPELLELNRGKTGYEGLEWSLQEDQASRKKPL